MYVLKPNVHSQAQSDNQVYVVSLEDPSFSYVNIKGIAARFFLAIEQERELSLVVEEILNEFEVRREVITQDLDKFLEFLLHHELIKKA